MSFRQPSLWTEIKIETSTGNLKLRNEIGKFKENIQSVNLEETKGNHGTEKCHFEGKKEKVEGKQCQLDHIV